MAASFIIPAVVGIISSVIDHNQSEDPSLETKRLPTKTQQQRDTLSTLIDELGGGEINAEGMSDRELDEVDEVLGRIGGRRSLSDQAMGNVEELLGRSGNLEQFFETNVAEPLTERFEEEVIPGIGDRFGGAGFFSSERRDAESDAMDELAGQLTQERSRVMLEEPRNDLQTGTNALASLFESERGLDTLALETTGLPRRTREEQRQRQIQNILDTIGIDTFENVAGMNPGTQSGMLGGFMSGIGSGMGSSMMSG